MVEGGMLAMVVDAPSGRISRKHSWMKPPREGIEEE
jgi:hypothetical protein